MRNEAYQTYRGISDAATISMYTGDDSGMGPAERLRRYSKVAPSGCIYWVGGRTSAGYGSIRVKFEGKWVNRGAHRIAYLLAYGEIPAGMQVHHICYTRACVNPAHLEVRTPKANVHDDGSHNPTKAHAEATHCKYGHPFSGENLYIRASGERLCRECSRRNAREGARRRRARQSLAPSGVSQ